VGPGSTDTGDYLRTGHQLFRGTVWHHRRRELDHSFAYPLMMLAFDLSEGTVPPRYPLLFGINTIALLSVRDRDFMHEKDNECAQSTTSSLGPLRKRLITFLEQQGGCVDGARIVLLTTPRILGYAFNPVNFYLVERDGIVDQIVCEVHNTFGQTHRYFAWRRAVNSHNNGEAPQEESRFVFPKMFCVSPFLDRTGMYRVTITRRDEKETGGEDENGSSDCVRAGFRPLVTKCNLSPRTAHPAFNNLSITVELFHSSGPDAELEDALSTIASPSTNFSLPSFAAGITGSLRPLTPRSLITTLVAVPGTGWLTMTRISWHALILIARRVSAFPLLPLVEPKGTYRKRSWIERWRAGTLRLLTGGRFEG
jgi:DUF1365 family protein